MAQALLTVPPVPACLPMALSNFTWHLLVPANATLDLRSPAPGGLRQSLPDQECRGAVALSLAEGVSDGGRPIGTFCQQGVVERMPGGSGNPRGPLRRRVSSRIDTESEFIHFIMLHIITS